MDIYTEAARKLIMSECPSQIEDACNVEVLADDLKGMMETENFATLESASKMLMRRVGAFNLPSYLRCLRVGHHHDA